MLVDNVKHCSAAEDFFCTLGVPIYFCLLPKCTLYADTGRVKAIYSSLIATLEEVAGEDRNHAIEARGILHQVKPFPFMLVYF